MTGIGRKATTPRIGSATKNTTPTNTTLTSVRMISDAPVSRNRSSWLTSSLSTASRPPVDWSSNHASSSRCTWRYASMRASCSIVWARLRHNRFEMNSVPDSISHTTTLIAASTSSWSKRSSTPNTVATSESSARTTTSTAAPISSSGTTSASLLSTLNVMAATTVRRWPRA